MIYIAVVDCTGHGVPGAFMSMLGVSFLNEIVRNKEIVQAGQILDELRISVIESLQQKGSTGEQRTAFAPNEFGASTVKDGMDMALVIINTKSLMMQYAGANNPCWIVKGVSGEIQEPAMMEILPDKMPVSIHYKMDNFTNKEYQLGKGDIIYLASDGYEDQFGGPRGRKFLAKNLKQMLLDNSSKPLTAQKEILDSTIETWATGYDTKFDQTDDIAVLGLKI
jgi:hypothetical protein